MISLNDNGLILSLIVSFPFFSSLCQPVSLFWMLWIVVIEWFYCTIIQRGYKIVFPE